ncbi:MAG: bis(5'-nucleosyl)-tetraphosphatase [Candidatus Bipolaricaulota bacterium]
MSSTSPDHSSKEQEKSGGVVTARRSPCSRRYLLLQHSNGGHWSFPKGHLEKGETTKEAAVRELAEETGLRPEKFIPDFREQVNYGFSRGGIEVDKTVVYYLALVSPQSEVKLSSEHLDFSWLPFQETLERVTYDNDREILERAENRLGEVNENEN